MPVIFRHKGFRFFFYSNEGSSRERIHVYAVGQGGEAKFGLLPTISLADSDGLDARVLRELEEDVTERAVLIEETWNEYFRT